MAATTERLTVSLNADIGEGFGNVRSLCVHCDWPGAAAIATATRAALERAGVEVVSATATRR
jgi:lactam utilization protein B